MSSFISQIGSRVLMGAVTALVLSTPASTFGDPVVPGFIVDRYANWDDPGAVPWEMAFAPSGDLYLGRDGGSSPDWRILRIETGGTPVEGLPAENYEYGETAIPDPDAVIFDELGTFTGVPGSVLVGSAGGRIWSVHPDDPHVVSLLWEGGPISNPHKMTVDHAGRLLVSDEQGHRIYVSTGELPTALIAGAAFSGITVSPDDRIFTWAGDAIRVYDAEGNLLDDAFVTGLQNPNRPCLAFGPGGAWGEYLYAIADGALLRVDAGVAVAPIGSGFDSVNDICFGPDGALYVAVTEDTVFRIRGQCDPEESSKLVSPDAGAGDGFGFSVGVDADLAAFGSPYDDDLGGASGAVWVFQREPNGTWVSVKKLTASDGEPDASFAKVAVGGDHILVGAHQDDDGAPYHAGAAYVFRRDQGGPDQWGEVKKLTAEGNAATEDHFGLGVAISGDTAIVGACVGHGAPGTGAAYVFERNEGGADNWGRVRRLAPDDLQDGDAFGWSVAIDGDVAVVGAMKADPLGSNSGAAYVFHRDQGGASNWGLVKKLLPSDGSADDWFGHDVVVDGESIVVSAIQIYDASHEGACYVFKRDSGGTDNWGQVMKLQAGDPGVCPEFGRGLSISSNWLAVGAGADNYNTPEALYLFHRHRGGEDNWGQVAKITGSDAVSGDKYGHAVAISGYTVFVGAGNHDHSGMADAGAVYEVAIPSDVDDDGIADECDSCPEAFNPEQEDSDGDGYGDICDNCPNVPNPDQADGDADAIGDACDNCPSDYNPGQADADGDEMGDLCDNCPSVFNPSQIDTDDDGFGDLCDNCPSVSNPDQEDCDEDGFGDACGCNPIRGDMNDDGVIDGTDIQLFVETLLGG